MAYNLRATGSIEVGANLISSIQKVAPHYTYCFIVPDLPEYKKIDYGNNKIIYYKHKTFFQRCVFDFLELRKIQRAFNPQVVLGLGNFGLFNNRARQAFLIHDSHLVNNGHKKISSIRDKVALFFKRYKLKRSLKYTQLVFCQTEVMKKAFLSTFQFDKPVKVIPNLISRAIFKDGTGQNQILDRHQRKFKLLQLGRYYAHKNIELSIRMFKDYQDELKDVVLFITIDEADNPKVKRLLKEIRKNGLEHSIVNIGRLVQEELAYYYEKCDALFFPTLSESFSVTYLEAMNFGLPIITSDLDFAHEICQDAALYFNPESAKEAKEKILALKTSGNLRNELILKGRDRMAAFPDSWDTVAASVVRELQDMR